MLDYVWDGILLGKWALFDFLVPLADFLHGLIWFTFISLILSLEGGIC